MAPIEKSTLQLAQFRSFVRDRKIVDKYFKCIIQGLDLDVTVPDTAFLQEYHSELIGRTLLHLAYGYLNMEAFNVLIHKGADFTAKNKMGHTIVHEFFHEFCALYGLIKWDIKKEESFELVRKIPFVTSTLSAHIQYKNTANPSDSNGLTHFHVACATNCVEAVEFFLNNGVSVNLAVIKPVREYFEGYTGLHFAAQYGHLKVIEILLKHGSNANLEDAHGRTPLHISLERNIAMIESTMKAYALEEIEINQKVIHLLLNHFVDSKLPRLCVLSALQNLDENVLRRVQNTSQPINMDSKNWPGYTALHFAAHVNVDTVKLLMEHGSDIEAKDANDVTPFDLCIERYTVADIFDILTLNPKWQNIELSDGKTNLIRLVSSLIDAKGISTFLQESSENVKLFVPFDSSLWPGFTVLHIAVLLSERTKCKSDYKSHEKLRPFDPNLSVIASILKQGADVTTKDHRGWTPVHLAFRLDKTETLKLLLKYHHKIKNFVDADDLSHLHIACAVENPDLVEKLLWNEADVNVVYKGQSTISCVRPGWTPLHVAVHRKNREIVKLLLKFGADVYATDEKGFTPIHRLQLNCRDLGRALFDVPNLRDCVVENLGLSHLHVACSNGHLGAVKRLLDLGVDVNKVSGTRETKDDERIYDGKTPLHCALMKPTVSVTRLQLVNLLIGRGADLLAKDSSNISPLHLILMQGKTQLLDILLQNLKLNEGLRKRVETETGVTMLHVACRKVDKNSIDELLKSGVDANARIHEESTIWPGYSPLHVLVLSFEDFVGDLGEHLYEFDEIVTIMLEHGADVTLMNAKRCTALHMAYDILHSDRDDLAVYPVKLLLKAHKNFEVNPTSVEGISHFHIACHMLDVEIVEKFLDRNVDVNATIDLFYNADIAACGPLLLATRPEKWRVNDSAESSAKLRIVDLLIKHGARVNVEDIDGNTPAHYAAFCSSKDESYLQLLTNNGANVNTRNVKGETPLELLVKKEDFKFEDIRYFIACGSVFNEFTLDTEEGYIALANFKLSFDDMKSLLEETFTKYPDSMKRDSVNRTAMHNLASIEFHETSDKGTAALLDVLMGFGCDADDEDNLGRTPLHLATGLRNIIGAEALLLVGADFSITDNDEKPPFAYVYESCLGGHRYYEEYVYPGIIGVFRSQIRKMEISNLEVNELNKTLRDDTEYMFESVVDHSVESFRSEFQRLAKMKIEPYSIRLADFTSTAVLDYPRMSEAKCDAIDAFFKKNKTEFRNKFPNAAGIFQLQYRQAVLRRKIMVEAKNSLSVLARFQVPDLCSDIILRFLENCELRKLIASTSCIESRSVDIAGDCVVKSKKPRF